MATIKRNQYKYNCDVCQMKFCSESDLINHKKKHGNPIYKQFDCFKCLNQFSSFEILEKHKQSCVGCRKKYACDFCGISYATGRKLDSHTRNEHKKAHLHKCGYCDAIFSWHENLMMHEKSHLNRLNTNTESNEINIDLKLELHPGNLKLPKVNKEVGFVCCYCNATFKYDFSYKAHMAGHSLHNLNGILKNNAPEELNVNNQNEFNSFVQFNEEDLTFEDLEAVEIDAEHLEREILSANSSSLQHH